MTAASGVSGTLAIVLSLLARWSLLSAMPVARFPFYLLSAHVLCRWTTLPLGTFISARSDGLGASWPQNPSVHCSNWFAVRVSYRRLGPPHAGCASYRGGQRDNAAQRLVLPLSNRRHYRRLLWSHQPTCRDCSLRVWSVDMSCTLILVRHAQTDWQDIFVGTAIQP